MTKFFKVYITLYANFNKKLFYNFDFNTKIAYIYEKNKNMAKKEQKKLTIAIEPELNKILEEGGFNKSKLINTLLKKYIKDFKEKNNENS